MEYRNKVQVGDVVKVRTVNSLGLIDTTVLGEIVGVRADYSNPDQRAVLVRGLELWIVLDDTVTIEQL